MDNCSAEQALLEEVVEESWAVNWARTESNQTTEKAAVSLRHTNSSGQKTIVLLLLLLLLLFIASHTFTTCPIKSLCESSSGSWARALIRECAVAADL
uniref:Uncharacterized protein n=1 Tax=Ditylenchus dipsaci TaxID=166011 RepID=A0A915CNG6_9BILA